MSHAPTTRHIPLRIHLHCPVQLVQLMVELCRNAGLDKQFGSTSSDD